MKKSIYPRIVYVLIVAGVFLSACSVNDAKRFAGIPFEDRRNLVVLVDFSLSPIAPNRHEFYKQVIETEIFPNLDEKDTLTVVPIDKSSATNAEEIFKIDFSKVEIKVPVGPAKEMERLRKKKLEEERSRQLSEFQKAFDGAVKSRNPLAGQTDLFGALENSKRYAIPDRPTVLIMLSDMLHHSANLSMEPKKGMNLDSEKFNKMFDSVAQIGLEGYTVLVLTGDQSGNSPEHFNLVKNFWTVYFDRNKASLFDYSSLAKSKVSELLLSAAGK